MKHTFAKSLAESCQLYKEAIKYAPGGVHSNFRLGQKPFPLFFERAEGSKLYDVDGNQYMDYALGMGPVILGHADPSVNSSVQASLPKGQLYAGQHREELELSRLICQVVPCAEMVRFSQSGSEAIQAALRLARAATERSLIVKFEGHYHGWFDNIYVSVRPDASLIGPRLHPNVVPASLGQDAKAYEETLVVPWNDFDLFLSVVKAHRHQVAAVIMEPILCNTSVVLPKPNFLEKVRELCAREGIILIFDEVITGFRVALGGAQEYLNVKPDLAIFAKAMANGYPISCLAGRRDLMELVFTKQVTHAGTYNCNLLSCVAAVATLDALRKNNGDVYSRLQEIGTALIEGLKHLRTETGLPLHVQGLPGVFHTAFTEQDEITDYRSHCRCSLDLQSRFVSLLLERGVRITDRGTWFLCAAHTEEDVQFTLKAAKEALLSLKSAVV
jgi:glutamate-1-semialdehyde 2,1-aminomutase